LEGLEALDRLSSQEVVVMFLGLGILLALARVLGELVKRLTLPAVVGEISGGIILGPTVFGKLAPSMSQFIFPAQGGNAILLDGLATMSISLFLLLAGMEINLSTVWKQGKTVLRVGTLGLLIPFSLGFAAALYAPDWLGFEENGHHLAFALFLATVLSVTALPVIAKILMDLDLYRSDLGMVIVAAAVLGDLIGWIIFALILGMVDTGHSQGHGSLATIVSVIGFAAAMLTVGRRWIHWVLPWISTHAGWPGGVLGFAMSLSLLAAAFTEWIGVHAIFGSFLVGVAIGDSPHFREQTRTTLHEFISFIFAPLFFASIGLRIDFSTHFDILLISLMLVITCTGKIVGCGLGAKWGGLPGREAMAVGFGMIAQGTMGIILGLLALMAGLIGERVFVSIVLVSLITSMLSGPLIQRALRRKRMCRLADYLQAKTFLHRLQAETRDEAIQELVRAVCQSAGCGRKEIEERVLQRERAMSTGLGNGVAVPHARIAGLKEPLVCVGLSSEGIDFNAPDGKPAQIILLLLSSLEDDCAQIELLADISRTFANRETRKLALQAEGFSEFMALIRSGKEF